MIRREPHSLKVTLERSRQTLIYEALITGNARKRCSLARKIAGATHSCVPSHGWVANQPQKLSACVEKTAIQIILASSTKLEFLILHIFRVKK